MRIVQTKVYQFDELDDKAKEKARDWFRGTISGDTLWSEPVIDEAKTIGAFLGFTIDRVLFSGFSNQGDGACFTGTWDATRVDVAGLKVHAPIDAGLHRIAGMLAVISNRTPEASFSIRHASGLYCHEHSVSFDFEWPFVAPSASDAEMILRDESREFMRWIYRRLESAYEFENSDEQVDANIRLNEYDFTIDGSRFT